MGYKLEGINEMCIDILKEIGNIGAGNASTAIANMLNRKINMKVPKAILTDVSKLGGVICSEEETVVGVFLEVTGEIEGSIMFILKLDAAHHMVNRLMGKDDSELIELLKSGNDVELRSFDEMELSAIKEMGNIIASSYMIAISNMLKLPMAPSVPYISVDMAAAILSVPAVEFGQYGDLAFLIETEFLDEISMGGYFILMPNPDSYEKIFGALGIQV